MPTITPCLWFDSQAEEAMAFYCSVFANSKSGHRMMVGDEPKRKALATSWELEGQRFTAINGGPHFKFTEAVSFMVTCDDQAEVDDLWDKLLDGGQASRCGWLKDRYGLSWQIVPARMFELFDDPDRAKAKRAMDAMMGMVKLDIAALERAAAG
ncbi:VOC family protein [Methylobacterium sp. C25]|uniref:VOC family protein n=1 Tax=Methylobacterium sp. C25 TaxID=2721622 RepID=UPI001F42792E|nr:VOC family protein [Methylobacterium sp. C25]MCE4224207.1 VOC family protein [Methylobacterium sp. C25]